jgi:polysaccharide pyruvyl transferase WcaK-like protein
MSASAKRVPLIYLYVPISVAREYRPVARSPLGSVKASLLRSRDRLRWTLLRSGAFSYHAWCNTEYTNRGDIAIREAIRQLLERKLGCAAQFVELDWGCLDADAVARINTEADLFVICGGGYVSADAATGVLSAVMKDVDALAAIRCPVVAFGIGYNSILECSRDEIAKVPPVDTVRKLKGLATACDFIACRDHRLGQILAEYAKAPISVIGDPALFLDPAACKPLAVAKDRAGAINIGLNLALHGPISAGIFRTHFEVYSDFLKRVQRSQPVHFWYFVHCDTERIAIDLLRKRGVKLDVVDLLPHEMIAAYSQMDFVICQMLHASILSANAGVPSINIGYDVKNASFYELMGLPELCIPHDEISIERLWSLWHEAFARRFAIANHLALRKTGLMQDTHHAVDKLAELLRKKAEGPVRA